MALNFNTDPYYDDFDPNKNYHRILFKPGRAVQARELTQLQTILQNQISNFADAIFAKNTPVSGGKITINLKCNYIKLNTQYEGADIVAGDFLNKIITDSTGTIVAKVIATAESTGDGGDPPTLIISYLSGTQFTDNTVIYPIDGTNTLATTIGTTGGTTCTGSASTASISQGIFYVVNGYNYSTEPNPDGTYSRYSIGNFVSVQPSTTILSKYSSLPTARIGLLITETYTDYITNPDLLDPTIGSTNYQAPGADRYIIDLTLITLSFTLVNDQNFIELVRIENGEVIKQVDDTVYSKIDDYFAKRTYDTNGDYVVDDFKITPTANTANSSTFDVSIGKGIAYVRGYRLENQSPIKLTTNKAREYKSINNNSLYISYGNFLYVNNVRANSSSTFDITDMSQIDLHSVPLANVVSANANTYMSTLVATARIRNLKFDHYNTVTDTSSYVYKMYIFDTATSILTSNAVSATTNTITFYDRNGKFSSKNDAYVGAIITIDTGTDVRKIQSYDGATKTATVSEVFSVTPTSSSTFSIRFKLKDAETIVKANTNYSVVSSASIDPSSKIGSISSGDTVLQDDSRPELIFPLGNRYVQSFNDTSYESQKYFRNKSFSSVSGTTRLSITLSSSALNFLGRTVSSGNLSNSEITTLFTIIVRDKGGNSSLTNGQILNFAGDADRNVSISNDRLTATFSATDLVTPLTVDVIATISVPTADNTSVVLRGKDLITAANSQVYINGTTVAVYTKVNLTYGQVYIQKAGIVAAGKKQSLFISDVKRIVKIIDTLAAGTVPTNAMLTDSAYDVTSFYTLSTGQTDNYYDHATITLKSGAPKARGNLLVLVDYYSHTGGDGYFGVKSYLTPISLSPERYEVIPVYTAKNGATYPLRDCLDFRPTRKNANATFAFAFTTDQTSSDSGALIPADLSIFTNDYSYYLPRKDLLILTKDRSFQFVTGTSSSNPNFPIEPDGALVLSQISLDAYTAYVPGENPIGTTPNISFEPVHHKRWRMQDISNLQKRINNIEYYTALNVLEQKAQSTQIPDVNGLNRFKNGILVDDFSSFATADSSNPYFSCSINKRTRELTAEQNVLNFPLQNLAALNSLGKLASGSVSYAIKNVNKATNLFSLPYTSFTVTQQQYATTTVNVNPFAVSIVEGVVELNPPMDNWVDNTKAPDLLIVNPNLQVYQQSDQVNQLTTGDWKVVPGTTTSSTATGNIVNQFNVVGHGINWSPFGFYGYTQTDREATTTTYGTLSQNNIMGNYTNIENTYRLNNNYITDISILPYIRPQQIMVRAKGLKVNAPITCTFDGVNVNDYMCAPDSIELKNVTGTFNENDVIGFFNSNIFYPIATVINAYNYPATANVRLSIVGNFHTTYQWETKIERIYNGFLNSEGVYQTTTASGAIIDSKIITVHKTGYVSTVGGTFVDVLGTTIKYYRVNVYHGPFSDTYGIWGTPTGQGLNLPAGKFNFTVPFTGTYYLRVGSDDDKFGYVKIDGTTYWNSHTLNGSGGVYTPAGITLTEGTHTFEIYCYSTDDDGDAYIAAAISSGPWSASSQVLTSGTVIFGTHALKGQTTPLNAGTQIEMPGGGLFYVGATQVSLNGMAKPVDSFYVGCKIKFISTYVEIDPLTGKATATPQNYTANITAFTASTCAVTLDTPVNISVGGNLNVGGQDLTSFYSIEGTETSYKLAAQKNKLDKLSTDETGTFVGIFNVPKGIFKNGERVFRVDNRTVSTDPTSATTYAEGTFTASGLATRSQALDFGASIAGAKNTFTQTKYLSNQVTARTSTTVTSYSPWDPLAQAFILSKDNYPNGLFIDSISVFFQSKPTTTSDSITLSIVNTLNGYPNGETLDYSIVTLTPDKVKTTTTTGNLHYLNPDCATVFQFPAPVYIQAGVLYAFILKSSSTEYNVYAAAREGTIIPSTAKTNYTDSNPTGTQKLSNAPYVGALFESQNGITWTADQAKSLMLVINRCKFTTGVREIPFVVPKGLPFRKNISNIINYKDNPDTPINNFNTYAGKNILSDAYNITTTDFIPNLTNIIYSYNATLNSTGEKVGSTSISPGKFGSPTYDDIYLSDGLGERVLLANSNNSFSLTATLYSNDDVLSPLVSDDGLSVYNVEWKVNNLGLSNNQIIVVNDGAGYDSNVRATVSAPDLDGGIQAYANVKLSGGNVQSVFVTTSGSGYLTAPSITITGPNTETAIISTISEYSPQGGNAYCRYLTKKVVLAPGNDSQDLRVYYTAYRPLGTNIYVFYKLLDSRDTSNFDDNSWKLMTIVGQSKNVFSKNRTDLYEFEAAPGTNGIADNYITYLSSNGQSYDSFIQFAIKIVITTNDRTTVPFLTNLRAIALPSGTGI